MPDLMHSLQGSDLGFLRMVAGLWGLEVEAPDAYNALPGLARGMCNRQLVNEVVEALPSESRYAIKALIDNEGRLPWATFCRRYGEVRVFGTARRDRERPDLHPASPAESLWYRALISKAFLNLPPEPQEYAYIPDELYDLLHPLESDTPRTFGRPASPSETAYPMLTTDRVVDHACTLLAALRMNLPEAAVNGTKWNIPLSALLTLLRESALIDSKKMPHPETTRAFLEASRTEALLKLAQQWLKSSAFNELLMLTGLSFEGEWQNYPLQTRQTLLAMLSHLPQNTWWSLNSFVNAVKEQNPDFQRPAGDYDSWFIRSRASNQYLRGFSSWDDVDGALIRFIITGPMYWLGFFDLAAPNPDSSVTAFRPSPLADGLWNGRPQNNPTDEDGRPHIFPDGKLIVPRLTPRSLRYQLARFCTWLEEEQEQYTYLLTPTSLTRAAQQGLKVSHLTSLLRKGNANPVPPLLQQALERFEQHGIQAQMQHCSLLRVASADTLSALQKGRSARCILEVLSPTLAIIKPGTEDTLRKILAEMGCLADIDNP